MWCEDFILQNHDLERDGFVHVRIGWAPWCWEFRPLAFFRMLIFPKTAHFVKLETANSFCIREVFVELVFMCCFGVVSLCCSLFSSEVCVLFVLLLCFCSSQQHPMLCLNIDISSQGFSGIPATWLNLAKRMNLVDSVVGRQSKAWNLRTTAQSHNPPDPPSWEVTISQYISYINWPFCLKFRWPRSSQLVSSQAGHIHSQQSAWMCSSRETVQKAILIHDNPWISLNCNQIPKL